MQNNVQPLIEPRLEQMQEHLMHLFGGFLDGCHGGLIEIAHTDADDHKLRHARLFGTDEMDEAAEFAYAQNCVLGQNVYVGAALRKPGTPRNCRATDKDVLCLTSFYADLDNQDAVASAKQNYRGCPPTCVVITGRTPHTRAQLWWRQETPETDIAAARAQNSALSVAFGGDPTVVNPSRVMRLGGSIAWPRKSGRVLEHTELQLFDDDRPKFYLQGQIAKAFPPQIQKPAANNAIVAGGSTDPLSVDAALQHIRDGKEWHNHLLRLIAHWIGRGWSDAEIHLATEGLTLPGYEPEQTYREVEQMITGARDKWHKPNPANPIAEQRKPLKPAFLQEMNIAALEKRRWLLGRSLLIGHLSLLIAPPGVGKSTLCLTQAVAVCIGHNLTQQPVYESGKVWIYNNEDDIHEMKRRLAAILQYHQIPFEKLRDRIVLSSGEDRPLLVAKIGRAGAVIRQPDIAACIDFTRQHEIKLFIVDPFVETHEVEENSNEQIKVVAQMFREIAREANCAVLLVHHTAKPPQGSPDGYAGKMNTARGASTLTGIARVVQTLFSMSAKDAELYGIQTEDQHLYIRLDDAKANLSLISPDALWFKRKSILIENGDEVGVLEPAQLKPAQIGVEAFDLHQRIISALLLQTSEDAMTLNAAAKLLAWGKDERFKKYRQTDSKGNQRASQTLRDAILSACKSHHIVSDDKAKEGFAVDASRQPVMLRRYRHSIDLFSQPEPEKGQ